VKLKKKKQVEKWVKAGKVQVMTIFLTPVIFHRHHLVTYHLLHLLLGLHPHHTMLVISEK
jgi:hypothetical protein